MTTPPDPEPLVHVRGIDHLVVTVADMDRAVAWYTGVLGMAPERLDEWRRGEAPFVSVRADPTTIIDLQVGERSGVNVDHVALVVDDDVDLAAIAASPRVTHLRGPARLFGAQGWGQGIYIADPDGNTIELRQYRSDPVE